MDCQALPRFVSEGLTRFRRDKAAGARFLSLESQQARDLVDELQVAVSFSQIRHGLNRYLQARTGRALSVCPLSELSETDLFTPERRWHVPAETALSCRMKSAVLTANPKTFSCINA